MTSATNFSLDDLTLAYSEEDYKPQRKEPKPGLWFEFAVREASIEQSKHGYLQVKLVTEALDSDGKAMFKKWVNIPVPVTIKDIVAPEWAKGLWLAGIRPLFPDDAVYDTTEKDEITGQKIYWKNGEQVRAGKEFDKASTDANKRIGERAIAVAKEWVLNGDRSPLPDYAGQHVFGRIIASKDGKYTNIERMFAAQPKDATVCYDVKEAFGK